MFRPRVIPCLLLKNLGLVKTVKFKTPRYIGDPINAVRIFNAKHADELIFLDINATKENSNLPINLLQKIGDECFMPFSVGGGIKTIKGIKVIMNAGAEKIIINSHAVSNPYFIKEAAEHFGSQSIVVSIDAKKDTRGKYEVCTHSGTKSTDRMPVEFAKEAESLGAGEIFINSIDKDGTMEGYDIELINEISQAVSIPVIACGGAGKLKDFYDAINIGGASAVAAGSFFVFHGKKHAVLINFPTNEELKIITNVHWKMV